MDQLVLLRAIKTISYHLLAMGMKNVLMLLLMDIEIMIVRKNLTHPLVIIIQVNVASVLAILNLMRARHGFK